MLCGCGSSKKAIDELSLYGAPRAREMPMELDRGVYENDSILRSDQEYPDMCMTAINRGFDSGFDSPGKYLPSEIGF